MKNISNNLTCLFGFHSYSKKLTKDKEGDRIYLCTICKRNGLYRDSDCGRQGEYDKKGNLIYTKNNDGDEQWLEYDKKGNMIHYKCSDGYEEWYEYNSKGKLTHYEDSDGHEEWIKYNSKGKLTHYEDSSSREDR